MEFKGELEEEIVHMIWDTLSCGYNQFKRFNLIGLE